MADIKIRDVNRGTIKTLDRAASSMHHLKEATIRTKSLDISSDHDRWNPGDQAQEMIGSFAAEGVLVAKGSVNLIHSEGKRIPRMADRFLDRDELIQNAFRKHGIKTIRNRQRSSKMADAEVIRNIGEYRPVGRIRKDAAQSPVNSNRLVHQRRKEHAIRRIREGSGFAGGFWNMSANNGHGVKAAKRIGRILHDMARSLKALVSTMSAGGTAALLIIVILVFFGAALSMTEDGNYYAGAGDNVIVEVARAEIGNTGGDKFWKWYGFSSHVNWCCCFVSWCADRCGYIQAGVMPKFAACGNGVKWFKDRHRWSGKGYSPHPGDLIFFDYQQDGVVDHVGLVESCDGKTVSTIEGNSGNSCRRNSYPVGDSRIAGYGLLVKPFMAKAQKIAQKATELAYPDAPKEAKYKGGHPTAAYAAALDRAYPNRSGWEASCKAGVSCDIFVGVCMVDSGVDEDFPSGYIAQAVRLDKRTDLYECIISTTSRNIQKSELKDGDILIYDRNDGGNHICIYVGGRLKHAGINKWYPRTTSAKSRLKIKGKKMIKVYRVIEDASNDHR